MSDTPILIGAYHTLRERITREVVCTSAGYSKAEYIRADLHEAERARAEKAEVEADCANDNLQTALKNAEAWKARAEKAEAERDAAIASLSEAARLRGEAEGKLLAAETPGVLEGWRRRAEAAEAKLALYQEYFDAVEAFDEDEGFSLEMMDRVNAARAAIRAMKGSGNE